MKKFNIPFSPPDISQAEIDEVCDTLRSGWITTGKKTKLFEQEIAEYLGTSKAVCLNSATSGLELCLRILEIKPGDEVITSAYTYTASASVIEHVGAKIVLCDTAPDSYEMDYDKLPELINERTKAIIPVDIAGRIVDYDTIFRIVESKREIFKANGRYQNVFQRIAVIADGAHSFGAEKDGVKAGNIADFTVFSFHAVKNLTCAEGGAVTWRANDKIDDTELYKEFMLYSLHGQSKDAFEKNQKGSWEYDIRICGYKCNMTDILASVGLIQLRGYGQKLARRRQIIEYYNSSLKDTEICCLEHYGDNFKSSGHLYLTRIAGIDETERNEIIVKMAEAGIATNVHYKPLPMHTAYKNMGFDIIDFPNAYNQYKNEITLPLNTCISDEEVEYTIKTYKEIVKLVK